MTLADRFASLFEEQTAIDKLALLSSEVHTVLPTFNLSTTSLRHLNKWLDRLHEIHLLNIPARPHGNYFSDPAALGLVNTEIQPPALTQAGLEWINHRPEIYNNPSRAEYELLKILYFSAYPISNEVRLFLNEKYNNLKQLLEQFSPTPYRNLFLSSPSLLVIAELIYSFPGAIRKFLELPQGDLVDLSELGENGFQNLFPDDAEPIGIARLCRRIGADYTRGQERRLHYIVSMCLLTIYSSIQPDRENKLLIPEPFSNILTEVDIYNLYPQYTSDFNVWFTGEFFETSITSIPIGPILPPGPINVISVIPQVLPPAGRRYASARDISRDRRRAPQRSRPIISDPIISERAEDYVEISILNRVTNGIVVRAGHRDGENYSLMDGFVPGADFYIVDINDNPIEFIEVKSVTTNPPVEINITRAEYLRACRCADSRILYRLILVNVIGNITWEIPDFANLISRICLSEIMQLTVRVG